MQPPSQKMTTWGVLASESWFVRECIFRDQSGGFVERHQIMLSLVAGATMGIPGALAALTLADASQGNARTLAWAGGIGFGAGGVVGAAIVFALPALLHWDEETCGRVGFATMSAIGGAVLGTGVGLDESRG